MHAALVWHNWHGERKFKQTTPKKRTQSPVLTRARSSHNPNRLPALDVQVQPIKNERGVVSVSHPIVLESYLPAAWPVLGTGPHFEGVSVLLHTGLKSRIRTIESHWFPLT